MEQYIMDYINDGPRESKTESGCKELHVVL